MAIAGSPGYALVRQWRQCEFAVITSSRRDGTRLRRRNRAAIAERASGKQFARAEEMQGLSPKNRGGFDRFRLRIAGIEPRLSSPIVLLTRRRSASRGGYSNSYLFILPAPS